MFIENVLKNALGDVAGRGGDVLDEPTRKNRIKMVPPTSLHPQFPRERDGGSETTCQLKQNSGASVIKYLKMIGMSCLGDKKLNELFALWSKMKKKDYWPLDGSTRQGK